jgi:signal transduction histidine kinase
MKLSVDVMEDEVRPKDKSLFRRLQALNKQCEEMIVDVRRMSANLRPTVLDDFGLTTALELLTREFEKLHKVAVQLDVDESVRLELEPQVEIALYRIAQEALSNVAKHADASRVGVKLKRNGKTVNLRISDNGRGFNAAELSTRRDGQSGLGLISMRERTELVGGIFELQSASAQGTAVTVTIPK